MLYDNGGLPAQNRPTGAMGSVPYAPTPRPTPPQQSAGPVYTPPKLNALARQNVTPRYPQPMYGQQQGGYGQPSMYGQQPMYGQQQPPWMQKRRRFLGSQGAAGGGGMYDMGGMQQLDHNGNSPGEWDYQQPQQQYRPPMTMYAR